MPLRTTPEFVTPWLVRQNRDEPSDAPKSANGAFWQWRNHRADLVIRNVPRMMLYRFTSIECLN